MCFCVLQQESCILTNPATQHDSQAQAPSSCSPGMACSPRDKNLHLLPTQLHSSTAGAAPHCSTLGWPCRDCSAIPRKSCSRDSTTAGAALCQDGSKAEHTCCRCCCFSTQSNTTNPFLKGSYTALEWFLPALSTWSTWAFNLCHLLFSWLSLRRTPDTLDKARHSSGYLCQELKTVTFRRGRIFNTSPQDLLTAFTTQIWISSHIPARG